MRERYLMFATSPTCPRVGEPADDVASPQKRVPFFQSCVAAQALRKVPGVNASWFPDFIRQYHDVDVGVAVQTPGGLMVPVVRNADLLGLAEIGATVKELAGRVRANPTLPYPTPSPVVEQTCSNIPYMAALVWPR